jgi:signal transduction histidine kinase
VTIGLQVAGLALQFVVTIIAVRAVVLASQNTMKAELQRSIDEVKASHNKSVDEARAQAVAFRDSFTKLAMQINTLLEGDVRGLQARVGRLEAGQDEWTKALRQRTHDLATEVNALRLALEVLKVKGQS